MTHLHSPKLPPKDQRTLTKAKDELPTGTLTFDATFMRHMMQMIGLRQVRPAFERHGGTSLPRDRAPGNGCDNPSGGGASECARRLRNLRRHGAPG